MNTKKLAHCGMAAYISALGAMIFCYLYEGAAALAPLFGALTLAAATLFIIAMTRCTTVEEMAELSEGRA